MLCLTLQKWLQSVILLSLSLLKSNLFWSEIFCLDLFWLHFIWILTIVMMEECQIIGTMVSHQNCTFGLTIIHCELKVVEKIPRSDNEELLGFQFKNFSRYALWIDSFKRRERAFVVIVDHRKTVSVFIKYKVHHFSTIQYAFDVVIKINLTLEQLS